MSIFTIPGADRSIYYLGQIFGSVGSVLPGTPNTFMGSLFLTINTIALTVGAIIVVYTTVVGLMMTAHEGEFLGKKWSGLWVPIRMVAGVASLFPAASGYSMIQVVIMWIIVQGVGAADTLWAAAVTSAIGAPTSQAVSSTTTSGIGVSSQMKTLFMGLVCEQTYGQPYPNVPNNAEIALKRAGFADGNYFDINGTSYPLGPSGVCGAVTKCSVSQQCSKGSTDSACSLCKVQNTLLQDRIIPFLRGYARQFVTADSQYLVFYYLANQTPPTPPIIKTSDWANNSWVATYCTTNKMPPTDMGSSCCVPPSESSIFCLQDSTPPSDKRNFPSPYQDKNKISNGMSIGANLQLDWVERWAILPGLTGKPAPVSVTDLTSADLAKIDLVLAATTTYTNTLMQEASDIATKEANAGTNTQQGKFVPQEAIDNGWITAGAYFYKVVYAVSQNLQSNMMPLSVSIPKDEVLQNNYRSNYLAAQEFLQAIAAPPSSTSTDGSTVVPATNAPTPGNAGMDAPLNDVSSTLSQSFMSMLQGSAAANPGIHDTPLLRIATFGQNLLIIAQLFYVLIIGANALFAALVAVGTITLFGNGNVTAPLEAFKAANALVMPALYLLLGALMSMGALLGMYVPMIPFVVFTASVIGWFIAVIEAMVAAPIVALGILSPGGQSEIFGRAEPSVMIIFNLFLRPTLMVFGLLVASFLANVVIKFIAMGFQYMMQDVMTLMPGLVEEIIFIAIFASIIFTSMNQVFTLIHHIPERILTYIGGQAMQYGEGQAAQAMKQAVEGAAGGLAAAGKGTGEGAATTAGHIAKKGKRTGGKQEDNEAEING